MAQQRLARAEEQVNADKQRVDRMEEQIRTDKERVERNKSSFLEALRLPTSAPERNQLLQFCDNELQWSKQQLERSERQLEKSYVELQWSKEQIERAYGELQWSKQQLEIVRKGKRRDVFKEISEEIMKPLTFIPDITSLTAYLEQDLSFKIPLDSLVFEEILAKARTDEDETVSSEMTFEYLERSDTISVSKLESVFRYIAFQLRRSLQGSEDLVHYVYDSLIYWPLKYFFPPTFTFNCNAAEEKSSVSPTTQAMTRPDFLFMVKNLLIFRGEEKRSGESLTVPERELLEKSRKWNPAILGRDISYLFAFAAAGYKFRLFVLYPHETTLDMLKMQIGTDLDISKVRDALKLVKWVFRLAPLINHLSSKIVENAPPLGHVWRRVSGRNSKIIFHDEYVQKILISDEEFSYTWHGESGLKALYDLKLPKLIRLRDFKEEGDSITLHLVPLGYRGPPRDVNEVKQCLKDVLTALNGMHEHQWVHRDVKIANVILCLTKNWILIDLDLASKLNDQGEAQWPFWAREGYPMPQRINGEGWKPKHDIQHVAMMLEKFEAFTSKHKDWKSLVTSINNSETATEALQKVEAFQFNTA